MDSELEYALRLYLTVNIGQAEKIRLMALFGKAGELFKCDRECLLNMGLENQQIDSLWDDKLKNDALKLFGECESKDIRIVPLNNDEYPEMLRYIHDPPLILFVRGEIPSKTGVAVVGSRKASGYGIETTVRLSSELSRAGLIVVSGMARGIDTAAHNGALQAGGKTIAVLGCGVDMPYPPENRDLMNRIIKSGAVVSEYPPGTHPATYHFPCRNRIISGMTLGTLVVEAGLRSGSLITANQALEQGRDVFAVPGNINNYNSMGTNRLIKDGARIVLGIEDILEELPHEKGFHASNTAVNKKDPYKGMNQDERKIMDFLKLEDLYDEELSQRTQIPMQPLFELLLELELKGFIQKSLTGKYRHLA